MTDGGLPLTGMAEGAILLSAIGTAPLLWALMHEALHGHLLRHRGRNRLMGRAIGWLLGFSWDAVRFGHLAHHRLNRHALDRPEELRPGQSWCTAALPYYLRLLGGHAAQSCAAGFVLTAPAPLRAVLIRELGARADSAALRDNALHYFGDRERITRMRQDGAMICLLLAAGLWWNWTLVAACIWGRWMAISLLDNAPHYATPSDGSRIGRNMRLGAPWRWLILNQNFHGLHHQKPQLRWHELPAHFREVGADYDSAWLPTVLAQLRGPVALLTGAAPLPADPRPCRSLLPSKALPPKTIPRSGSPPWARDLHRSGYSCRNASHSK
jgi:fatty acid desaturase